MYCVFHHISGHLPRQIWFWEISTKTWASVRPPLPLVGPNAQLFPKMHFDGPLIIMIKITIMIMIITTLFLNSDDNHED